MAEGRFERFSGAPDPTPRTPVDHSPPPAASGDIPPAPAWVGRLPDQYRENPDAYFDHVAELERQAQEAETWRQYGTQAQTYITWAQDQLARRGQEPLPGQIPQPRESQETRPRWRQSRNPLDGADWDNPETPQTVLRQFYEEWQADRDELRSRHDLTDHTIEERTRAVQTRLDEQQQGWQQLLGYWDRVNRLELEGLYEHAGYKPAVTRDALVAYMREHPGIEIDQARAMLTEQARIDAARQAGIEEGRREAQREAASRTTTTELTRGTPPRRPPAEVNPHRGYGTRPQALYDRVSTRLGRSDW
jgi:hypothetical protein